MPGRAAVVGATLLLMLLATWAASVGPRDVLRGDGPSRVGEAVGEDQPSEEPSGGVGDGERSDDDDEEESGARWGALLSVVAQLVGALLLVYVVVLVARRRRRPRSRRRREPDQAPDPEFEVLEPRRTLEAMVSDADDQQAMLRDGEPRNAIVACWHRFEIQASSIGLAREPWETSSEFTMRLLDVVSADSAAVAELAGLYREARFSDHAVDETSRARAAAALSVIHAGLRRRLGGVGAPR